MSDRYHLVIWGDQFAYAPTRAHLFLDEDEHGALITMLREWENAHLIESWRLTRQPCEDTSYFSEWANLPEIKDRIAAYDDWLSGQEIPYDEGGGSGESASYRNALTDAGRGHLLP